MIENQTVERKREYNDKVNKTLLAFLNTDGGVLYIGMADDGSVYGLEGDADEWYRKTVNSFRDSVTPDPTAYFHAEPEQRDDKWILKITVERGSAIPYCFAKYGLVPEGVWVRIGSNTVTATREHIRQMIKDNGTGLFISELSIEQNLTFEYAGKVFAEKDVKFGKEQKRSLGLLRPDDRYTNLALILSDQCPYTTKAAIFDGLNKDKFKDRKEFTGSLFKQIEDVHAYLHVYNRIRGTFEGVYRVDHPDYPDIAIREAYVNALIHRDYYIEGSVLVSMFDDRLEFMSLGGIMPGVTYDLMLAGVSVARNEKLAQIFYRLNIIEAFGTGIPRIFGSYENSSVKPEIPVVDGGFLIRIPNMNYELQHEVAIDKITNGSNEQKLLTTFMDTSFNKEEAAEALGITVSGAYKLLQRMKEQGLLIARKESRQWVYSSSSNKTEPIRTSNILDMKIVGFTGIFDGGSTRLKDLVYAAGGAPSDTIPVYTNYLVVGRGGKDTKAYKEASRMIKVGAIIELTENELRRICAGEIPAPERTYKPKSNLIVTPASEEGQRELELQEQDVFEAKRAAFVHRYGVLRPDGSRDKRYLG